MSRRIGLATLSALLGLVVSVMAFGRAPGAIATQGQPIIAGQTNTETDQTVVRNTNLTVSGCLPVNNGGLMACGSTGVWGVGTGTAGVGVYGDGGDYGVYGEGDDRGVWGFAESGGTGVLGTHDGATGIGVQGRTAGVGSGVYGEATGDGVGVFGDTTNGTGVIARSTSGNALDVRGKARFSRSGTATVVGTAATPRSAVTVTNVALTTKSLVLVTPQKNVPGVWVRAAVPNRPNSRFTLYLNKNVSVGFPVAWMVVEKP